MKTRDPWSNVAEETERTKEVERETEEVMVVCGQEASKQFREQADAGHVPVAHRSQILIKSEACLYRARLGLLCTISSVFISLMVVKTELAEGSGNTVDVSLVKKKSRKGKEVSTGDAVAAVDVVDKKEKKKGKKVAKDEGEEGDKSVEDIDQEQPKKRSKRREEVTNEDLEPEVAEEDVKKHKKKRKHRDDTANDQPGSEATEEDAKSHKKKKRRHSGPEDTIAQPDKNSESVDVKESGKKHKKSKKDDKPLEQSDKPKKEKKKRRKHSEHGYKDPSSDESLSDQANKGTYTMNTSRSSMLTGRSSILCLCTSRYPLDLEIQQSSTKLADP